MQTSISQNNIGDLKGCFKGGLERTSPSAAGIDSQRVKSTARMGEAVEFGAGKQIKAFYFPKVVPPGKIF